MSLGRSLHVKLSFSLCLSELFSQGYNGFHHSDVKSRLAVFLEGRNQTSFNQALCESLASIYGLFFSRKLQPAGD